MMRDAAGQNELVIWRKVTVGGIVQGIGFRPTVFRLAEKHGIVGEIRNTASGVVLHLGGRAGALRSFLEELPRAIPSPGRIETLAEEPAEPIEGCKAFRIAPSIGEETIEVVIPPDQATCAECLGELFDPGDRRFRYPLITCAVCGPRYSIIEKLPYDRERTTMRRFPLCDRCRNEYEDPRDRRFHAETVACPQCGPNVELLAPSGSVEYDDPIEETVALLKEGRIVAIKGIGGYHLACDAANERAVAELRRRKNRPRKPFAILVADLDAARRLCEVGPAEADLLRSPEAPIVLLKKRGRRLAASLAPDNNRLGVMLAYTPIQHLIARRFEALVMTSGNITDEPIRYTEEGVRDLLGPIADFALVHPREIVNPSDDSVAVVQRGRPILIRRSRGYVPTPITYDKPLETVLAVGADLKNTCAFSRQGRIYLSPHIGDLEYPAAFRRHVEEIERFGKWFGEKPRAVACDLHPGYLSAQNAHHLAEQWEARLVEVQHHHAHIAACLADNAVGSEAIGVAFDGTGYGTDGTIWGGEFLIATRGRFRRAGRIAAHSLPGGERSIREPWRMAAAYLIEMFGLEKAKATFRRFVEGGGDVEQVARMLDGPVRQPRTSSVGRLFDAVAVLLGFPCEITFEAQNAVALESLCRRPAGLAPYDLDLAEVPPPGPDDGEGFFEVRLEGLFAGILADLEKGVGREAIAERFHATVVEAIVRGCRRIRGRTGLERVALSGGCFVNTVLVEGAAERLEGEGFDLLLHRRVPPNDGGIALGQAATAAAHLAGE